MMGKILDHRTETADSVAHLASASSIRQPLNRPFRSADTNQRQPIVSQPDDM